MYNRFIAFIGYLICVGASYAGIVAMFLYSLVFVDDFEWLALFLFAGGLGGVPAGFAWYINMADSAGNKVYIYILCRHVLIAVALLVVGLIVRA